MKLWRDPPSAGARRNACYGPGEEDDIRAAERVCARLGIALHVFDCAEEYEEAVLRNFREEYLAGRTPNPCVRCNPMVKFGVLPEAARRSGLAFDRFATGHYARVEQDVASRRYLLKKGLDPRKDQSYFLYRLSQAQLAAALFPLGGLLKSRVREIARAGGLARPRPPGEPGLLRRRLDRARPAAGRRGGDRGRQRPRPRPSPRDLELHCRPAEGPGDRRARAALRDRRRRRQEPGRRRSGERNPPAVLRRGRLRLGRRRAPHGARGRRR